VIKNLKQPVKVLGDGDVSTALNVRVHKVSASARAKIEAAGGSVQLIEAEA
jgi:large subunit ribosomal protein L15